MIRPDSAARRDAGDGGEDVQAWIQQLASDDPIGPPDQPSASDGAEAAAGEEPRPEEAEAVRPARRGWRGRRAGRRRSAAPADVPERTPVEESARQEDARQDGAPAGVPAATGTVDPDAPDLPSRAMGADTPSQPGHVALPDGPGRQPHAASGVPDGTRSDAPGGQRHPADRATDRVPGGRPGPAPEPPGAAHHASDDTPRGRLDAADGRRRHAVDDTPRGQEHAADAAPGGPDGAHHDQRDAALGDRAHAAYDARRGQWRADAATAGADGEPVGAEAGDAPRPESPTEGTPAIPGAPAARTRETAAQPTRHLDRVRERTAATDGDTRDAAARLRALAEFVSATEDRVPAARLAPARELIGRAGERLELSDRHTVVVLAGTTGSGKSSLFNAVSGLDLSRVGVRRPTTGELHGCVWDPDGAPELLDWLGVPERRRTVRESVLDGDAQKALRGLILLDLPDFDSVEEAHRAEVDRLVGVVDLVVWVVDPQKYADRTLHEKYLSPLVARESSTAVVLNQVDRLSPADAERCAEDLGRLLVEDGLGAVPLHLTSARTGAGVAELRTVLARAVADRRAAARRVASDLDAVAAGLADLAPPDGADDALAVEERTGADLPDRLAELAGLPGLLDVSEQDYRRRARRATGWLFVRWALGGRDVRRQLEQERYDLDWLDDPATRSRAAAESPSRGQRRFGVAGILRGYLDAVAGHLPESWLGAARTAVATHASALVERLSRLAAVATRPVRPGWWLGMTVAQWVFGGCAVAGAVWLLAALSGPFGYPAVPTPFALPVVLLLGGLALGALLALAAVPLVRAGAREYRRAREAELRSAVADAATSCVREPVRAELTAYERARATLRTVRSGR